jgi:two-component system chemotaxis response regulator CheY
MPYDRPINPLWRVIVVDDFASIRHVLCAYLEEVGIVDVDQADDGDTAAKLIRDNDYDLAIIDWLMPRVSGMELLRGIRSDPQKNHLPVIVITSTGLTAGLIEAIEQGATEYLVKPFSAQMLANKIRAIVK